MRIEKCVVYEGSILFVRVLSYVVFTGPNVGPDICVNCAYNGSIIPL